MKKYLVILGITFLTIVILYTNALAASININPGDIQIEVGGILLGFEGGISILDQLSLSDSGDNMSITVSDSSYAKFISSNRREFNVTSSSFVKKGCESSRSFVVIETPDGTPATTITITPLTTTCSNDSGGGGGGGGGASGAGAELGVALITPTTIGEIIEGLLKKVEEMEKEEKKFLPKLNFAEILNLIPQIANLQILNLELPTLLQEPEPLPPPAPLNIETVVETVKEMASTITAITNVAAEGVVKIFNGIATGSEGSIVIAEIVEDTGVLEWETQAPESITEKTNANAAPEEPGVNLEERKDYTITIQSATDPNIQTESEPFELRAKRGAPIIKTISIENIELSNIFYILKNLFFATKEIKAAEIATTKPTLKIIRPKAGDVWIIGEKNKIEWESENLPAGGVSVGVKKGFDLKLIISNALAQISSKFSELSNNAAVRTSVKYILFPSIIGIFVILYLATRPLRKN